MSYQHLAHSESLTHRNPNYHMLEKVGKFDKSSVIHQTKTIFLMAESIHSPNFSSPSCEIVKLSLSASMTVQIPALISI